MATFIFFLENQRSHRKPLQTQIPTYLLPVDISDTFAQKNNTIIVPTHPLTHVVQGVTLVFTLSEILCHSKKSNTATS